MIKIDLIKYLKTRRNALDAEIKALKLPENECIRNSATLRKLGAISEINKTIRILENK